MEPSTDLSPPTVLTVTTVDLGPGVRAGFTTRAGGVSTGDHAGLDLALHVGDEPSAVAENRRRLGTWAGAPVRFGRQVHGTRVARVDGSGRAGDDDEGEPEADALVTTGAGVPLGVLVADCVPVLLADPDGRVAAVAHAGRRGLLAGVLAEVLSAMTAAGARADRVRAAIGPAAGGCCYEVPAGLQQEVTAVLPGTRATTTWGTPSLDLRAGAAHHLRALGVAHVTTVGGCTVEDPALYSYRRSRVTGRFAGVVVLAP